MLDFVYSPTLGRGVVYDGDVAMYVLEADKMYQPESAQGVHIGMLMQGPGDYLTMWPGEYPFREAYDEMSRAHEDVRRMLLERLPKK